MSRSNVFPPGASFARPSSSASKLTTATPGLSGAFRIDSREGKDAEAKGYQLFAELLPRIERIVHRTEAIRPPALSSRLGSVDEVTNPFKVSEQLKLLLIAASDNLRTTMRYIVELKELPMTAHYALIRTAVESASIGQWVLDATAKSKRAGRSLRITRANLSSHASLGPKFVKDGHRELERLQTSLKEVCTSIKGVDPGAFELIVQSTAVIRQMDRSHPAAPDEFTRTQVWRATSGMLHGNMFTFNFLLERHPDGDAGEQVMRTSRMSLVAGFLLVAVVSVELLLDTVEAESKPIAHRGQAQANLSTEARDASLPTT